MFLLDGNKNFHLRLFSQWELLNYRNIIILVTKAKIGESISKFFFTLYAWTKRKSELLFKDKDHVTQRNLYTVWTVCWVSLLTFLCIYGRPETCTKMQEFTFEMTMSWETKITDASLPTYLEIFWNNYSVFVRSTIEPLSNIPVWSLCSFPWHQIGFFLIILTLL